MSVDHVLLEYSLFRIGVIAVPLDLRLPAADVIRVVEMLRPRGFVSLGLYGSIDFREMGRAFAAKCSWVEHFFMVELAEPSEGFRAYAELAEGATHTAATESDAGLAQLAARAPAIAEEDGALVIFTTARPARPRRRCSRTATSRRRICACAARFSAETAACAHWSICPPRTSARKPRS